MKVSCLAGVLWLGHTGPVIIKLLSEKIGGHKILYNVIIIIIIITIIIITIIIIIIIIIIIVSISV